MVLTVDMKEAYNNRKEYKSHIFRQIQSENLRDKKENCDKIKEVYQTKGES